MRILILGGTMFLGRALVESAQAAGHEVTLFNRGKSNPDLFPDVERLRGDRDSNLEALKGRRWDAAIDTCGYVPRVVKQSASLLADAVQHYTFISSISVYRDLSQVGIDETAPVGTLPDRTVEEVTGETYGPLKALCEQAAEAEMPGRVLTIRPGLVVGPHDPSDRFTYWPYRVAQGGDTLAPGRPSRRIQYIDVRDLADWTLRMCEGRQTRVYNAASADAILTMGRLLQFCKSMSRSSAEFVWMDDGFLESQKVGAWTELPLWIPEKPEHAGFFLTSASKAVEAGLTFRPIADTVKATLDWIATWPPDRQLRAGLKRERETELLDLWKR